MLGYSRIKEGHSSVLQQMRDRLVSIIVAESTVALRLMLSMCSILWGLSLWTPGMFASFPATYQVMSALMPQHVWSTLFLFTGLISLFSLLLEVRTKFTIGAGALLTAIMWTASTLSCLATWWPVHITGFISQALAYRVPAVLSGDIGLMVASWVVFVRHASDRRVTIRY